MGGNQQIISVKTDVFMYVDFFEKGGVEEKKKLESDVERQTRKKATKKQRKPKTLSRVCVGTCMPLSRRSSTHAWSSADGYYNNCPPFPSVLLDR